MYLMQNAYETKAEMDAFLNGVGVANDSDLEYLGHRVEARREDDGVRIRYVSFVADSTRKLCPAVPFMEAWFTVVIYLEPGPMDALRGVPKAVKKYAGLFDENDKLFVHSTDDGYQRVLTFLRKLPAVANQLGEDGLRRYANGDANVVALAVKQAIEVLSQSHAVLLKDVEAMEQTILELYLDAADEAPMDFYELADFMRLDVDEVCERVEKEVMARQGGS